MTIDATVPSGRPAHGEYAAYGEPDIRSVAGDDALAALRAAAAETHRTLRARYLPLVRRTGVVRP